MVLKQMLLVSQVLPHPRRTGIQYHHYCLRSRRVQCQMQYDNSSLDTARCLPKYSSAVIGKLEEVRVRVRGLFEKGDWK